MEIVHHSPGQRLAEGKALRNKAHRREQAAWKPGSHRRDPVAQLKSQDTGRLKQLLPIRYGRMVESPFAFFRGSANVMAADLAKTPATGLLVQACGDCHLMNFGGFATPERNVIFDLNDFDESLPAPWEWDVKRLAASFVLAARSRGLHHKVAHSCAAACVRSYRERVRELVQLDPLRVWYSSVTIQEVLGHMPHAMRARIQRQLDKVGTTTGSELDLPKLGEVVGGETKIRDTPPLVYHPKWARTPEFSADLEHVYDEYHRSLPDDRRALLERFRVTDVSIKVVGVGSVGRRCWIALLMSDTNEPLFLQFKEAVASVLEPYAGKSRYVHQGERVVRAQKLMQPVSDIFLGWGTSLNGRQFYGRQLRDAKVKPAVEKFDAGLLEFYAVLCGGVLARAHAKASDMTAIAGYLGASDRFDEAVADFAVAYADQTERDHALLVAAVKKGRVAAERVH